MTGECMSTMSVHFCQTKHYFSFCVELLKTIWHLWNTPWWISNFNISILVSGGFITVALISNFLNHPAEVEFLQGMTYQSKLNLKLKLLFHQTIQNSVCYNRHSLHRNHKGLLLLSLNLTYQKFIKNQMTVFRMYQSIISSHSLNSYSYVIVFSKLPLGVNVRKNGWHWDRLVMCQRGSLMCLDCCLRELFGSSTPVRIIYLFQVWKVVWKVYFHSKTKELHCLVEKDGWITIHLSAESQHILLTGVYPSCHWVRDVVHLGQVTSPTSWQFHSVSYPKLPVGKNVVLNSYLKSIKSHI